MKKTTWLLLTLLANAAQAQDLAACRAIADSAQRLACYDALPLPAAVAAANAAAASQRFGLEQKADGAAPDSVVSQIMGRFDGWGPNTVFTLANGQQWRVSDGSSAVVAKQDPKVTISRGMLGSFDFSVEGLNKTAKVRRVK